MNMNQIVNMVVRTIVRRLVNGGVNAGIDVVSNMSRKKGMTGTGNPDTTGNRGPWQASQGPGHGKSTQQAKRAVKMAQRMTKF